MKNIIKNITVLCFIFLTIFSINTNAKTKGAKGTGTNPYRILFIGNSFTYVNNIPLIVAQFCHARKISTSIEMVAPGAFTFSAHISNPATQKALEKEWDFVILQDQSQLPASSPEMSIDSGKILGEKAKKTKAKVFLYITWGYHDGDNVMNKEMQLQLSRTYCQLAQILNCEVAPVGPAFQLALDRKPKTKLYQPNDGNCHQALAGAYLAACVFYSKLFKKSPVGLPAQGKGFKLAPNTAKFLQEVAAKTVKDFSAQKVIEDMNKEEKSRPTMKQVEEKIVKNMTKKEAEKTIGKPEQSNDKDNLHIYNLQNKLQLWITYDKEDKLVKAYINGRSTWEIK